MTPRTAWLPLLAIAAVHAAVHLATAGNYGIFRDEYYYLACARHPAWGYVDHPPLSIGLLAVVRALLGEGVPALRLVPALAGAALIVLTGRTTATMGGGGFAQVLAAAAMAIAGVVQVITGFYSMNALDILFWAAAWSLLAAWLAEPRPGIWPLLGVVLGLGLLNKVGLLVLGAALGVALLAGSPRRVVLTRGPWLAAGIAVLLFLPHLVWQVLHGWPTLEFIENARRYKIAALSPQAFFGELVLEQHPANLPIWAAGLGWLLFARTGRRFRLLGITVVLALAILLLQRAKPYYAAGLFPVLFTAGACAWESLAGRRRLRWLRPVLLAFLAVNGLFFLPLGVPVLPVESFARWQATTGIAPAAAEVGHTSELPQHYSDRFGWEELAAEVSRVVSSLPDGERGRAVIIAQNYGHAGALEYWSGKYSLPRVVCGHNSYWFWAPHDLDLDVVVVVGWSEDDVRESFAEVERAGTLVHPWALESGLPIWVARRPTRTWPELHRELRMFI
jgi:4-amino-4-deoxy-L-arabinose transferase-like glycosyltransferase